jgi:hypothetical protein
MSCFRRESERCLVENRYKIISLLYTIVINGSKYVDGCKCFDHVRDRDHDHDDRFVTSITANAYTNTRNSRTVVVSRQNST